MTSPCLASIGHSHPGRRNPSPEHGGPRASRAPHASFVFAAVIRQTLRTGSTLRNLAAALMALALAWACFLQPAYAMTAAPDTNPALEAQVQALSHQLRCLVCQNQSIAESNAPLAVDLRNQVRDMLRQGSQADEVAAYLVERYGDFVLYRPPLRATTLLLWLGPFALLIAAVIWLTSLLRRRALQRDPPLTASQRATAKALLSTERQP